MKPDPKLPQTKLQIRQIIPGQALTCCDNSESAPNLLVQVHGHKEDYRRVYHQIRISGTRNFKGLAVQALYLHRVAQRKQKSKGHFLWYLKQKDSSKHSQLRQQLSQGPSVTRRQSNPVPVFTIFFGGGGSVCCTVHYHSGWETNKTHAQSTIHDIYLNGTSSLIVI